MTPLAVVTRKERILVVDDERGMRELLLALFRKNGFQTAAAPDAKEGFNRVAEIEPAVVIVDQRIAGGGGVNLIRMVKEHFPEVKCLFMTAYDSPETFDEAIAAGADDTIRKPFNILTMLGKVENLISAQDALKEAPVG